MVANTLRTALLGALEQLLNHALRHDPGSRQRLLALLESPLAICILPQQWTFYLHAGEDGLRLLSYCEEPPALQLRGTPLAMLAMTWGDHAVFAQGRVSMHGDETLAQALQQVISQLELDWEAALAEATGPVAAHFLGNRAREAFKWRRDAHESLRLQLEEFIHEESRLLPGRNEVQAHMEDITQVQQQFEQLELRLNRLQTQAQSAFSMATDVIPSPEQS